ncbi:hypothetical protein M9H77_12543 [Catharanthus roseus]|uniref:Uncharacterized protein n=1 Tax=Catharanthus roseus TaxID=4058 RepID=A0ACC0BHR1_CATRO|nr:hypothetical protein M9H77_12543 [Catharanthus roseus]
MKQCIELRKEIENAIRQGLLKDFIAQYADYHQEHKKKRDQEYRPQKTSQQANVREHKVINVISADNRKQYHKRHRQEEDDALLVVMLILAFAPSNESLLIIVVLQMSSSRMHLIKWASFSEISNLREHHS